MRARTKKLDNSNLPNLCLSISLLHVIKLLTHVPLKYITIHVQL